MGTHTFKNEILYVTLAHAIVQKVSIGIGKKDIITDVTEKCFTLWEGKSVVIAIGNRKALLVSWDGNLVEFIVCM